ncbi:CHAP domain-containing protein [Stakelama marina]|uniref:CHAP domain-containing protein n=1 Tax=Stakelama marina TaxID=2826939 RepID=A0A8T4IEP5_9SPHN|nr:CHAP domain-containing protein [Stakelama marina]MBR0551485.1 CHAP domain-containing protein [Stakelama marina]
MKLRRAHLLAAIVSLAATPASAGSILDYVGQCVPFARQASGIQIHGDAWTWWAKAKGRYERGQTPEIGSVLVFAKSPQLPLGHVAVVSRIVDRRVLMITHANWSRIDGERGHAERDVTLFDVSKAGDWSEVRVWYRDSHGLGATTYPTYGFIYGESASANVADAQPSPELTERHPDYVASLLDAYAR